MAGTPVAVGANPQAVAIDPGTDTAVVVNQNDNTVSIINLGVLTTYPQIVQMDPPVVFTTAAPVTLTLIGKGFLPGAQVRFNQGSPVPATVSANGRKITATIPTALLAQANRLVVDVQNSASVFSNVENLLVIQAVPVGMSPQGVAIDIERNLAVVTNKGSNNVTVVDMNTGGVLSTIGLPMGASPTAVAVLSRTGQAVVANEATANASIIDLTGVAARVDVSTGGAPHGVAINPDTGYAYVSNSGSNSLSAFLITGTGTPTSSAIAVDIRPGAMAIAPELHSLALAHETSNDLLLLDLTAPATPAIRSRIQGISFPTGVVYDPVSQLFMAISSLGNNLVVVDPVAGVTKPPPVRVGINPTSVAYNFQTSTLLTVNSGSNTLSVMDFPNRRVRSVLALNVSSTFQFAVDIHPRTNIAAIVDTANNRLLLVPMPR
jgi:DNA-binding beta-propeller fold protein YncE